MLLKIFLLICLCGVSLKAHSQTDTLIFVKGDKLACTIVNADQVQVRIGLANENNEVQEHLINLSQLQGIKYKNGLTQAIIPGKIADSLRNDVLAKDANKDYKQGYLDGKSGYKIKGPGTAAFLLGLTGGIIPAIIIAQVPPNDYHFVNLNEKILYTNQHYMKGYRHGAFKVKKDKIADNFSYGLLIGATIIAIIFTR